VTPEKAFALHISWTCYATWLPGDERGYVSNTLLPEGGFLPKENRPGTPYAEGDAYTRKQARNLQKDSTVYLPADLAEVAARAIVDAARKRGWRIIRAAFMANHVHVVIMDCPPDGEAVRRILKGVSQAALSERFGRNRRWWTSGGSDRYKNDDEAITNAVNYVADQPYKLVEIVDMVVHRVV
jgi:REP element-mobilizing transposase RayT